MFDDLSNPNQKTGQVPGQEPEDILAGIDAADVSVKGPAMPRSNIGAPLTIPTAIPPKAEAKDPFFKRYKKAIILIVVLVLGLGILGAGAFYGASMLMQSGLLQTTQPVDQLPINNASGNSGNINVNDNANANVNTNTNTNVDTNTNTNTNVDANVNTNTNTNAIVNIPSEPVDTDRDGITDEEEKQYGTNANLSDSDEDGLTDRDEIKVFMTDPNNADSDGDTFPDGQEVRNGYNPKGTGKLLEL